MNVEQHRAAADLWTKPKLGPLVHALAAVISIITHYSITFTHLSTCMTSYIGTHLYAHSVLLIRIYWLFLLPELSYSADRAFSRAVPTVWNALPSSVTSVNTFPSFKKALKAHLFQLAHDT